MSGDEPGVIAITQRELLLEMRENLRGLKATVDAIARDHALGVSAWRDAAALQAKSVRLVGARGVAPTLYE
jgi:hypothetical protein